MALPTDLAPFVIDPRRLWRGEAVPNAALLVVDLDVAIAGAEDIVLPPCPIVGFGDPGHPLAAVLDAVVEPDWGAAPLARQVAACPQAAAVAVQLLRLLPALTPAAGLTAESLAYGLLQSSAEHRAWLAGRDPSAGAEGELRTERVDDALVLTLDRPGSGNAIDRAMRDALHEALTLAALDGEIARVVLRGAGRCFSLGADLGEFGTTTDPATAHAIRALTLPAHAAVFCADKLEAEVRGACVGAGLELAAWARRVIATPDAWFQLPELAMGILPGAGGCVSVTRRIGRQRTALLILTGKRIGARKALDWGLIDRIVDHLPGDQDGADIG